MEGTAGNTGIGLSAVGNSRGYKVSSRELQWRFSRERAVRSSSSGGIAQFALIDDRLLLLFGRFSAKTLIVIADTQSIEKKNTLRWGGATLLEVPAVPFKNPNNYVHVAQRMAEQLKKEGKTRVLYADQWSAAARTSKRHPPSP